MEDGLDEKKEKIRDMLEKEKSINNNIEIENKDNGGCFLALLGMLFPYVGVILYFIWRKKSPRSAKDILKGSLISILFIGIFALILLGTRIILGYINNRI